jgi:putative addiction module component (TIGR02574 family)
MTEQSKKVLAEALELSPIERAALVEELLSSFDFPARQEIDALWAKEVEDRIDAYERGELRASPAEAVFGRLDRDQGKRVTTIW